MKNSIQTLKPFILFDKAVKSSTKLYRSLNNIHRMNEIDSRIAPYKLIDLFADQIDNIITQLLDKRVDYYNIYLFTYHFVPTIGIPTKIVRVTLDWYNKLHSKYIIPTTHIGILENITDGKLYLYGVNLINYENKN